MFRNVKGTTDFYPDEKIIQDEIFSKMSLIASNYGFTRVETPVFEDLSLLTKKSGDEIKSQIFVLEKRSKEHLGLRFEYTASLARMFIHKQKELTKPVKWFSIGRMWRYEQPQSGRLREFYQFNVEAYGSDKPIVDAEMINLATDTLLLLGLKKTDFVVRVNNRKLLEGLLQDIAPKNKISDVIKIIDKKEKISSKEFREELKFLDENSFLYLKKMLSYDISKLKKIKLNALAQEGFDELCTVVEYTDKTVVKFDITTARGLAYYTGNVFEIFDINSKYRALCGGGRYDNMVELFGGEKTAATGFAMGYSTVSLLLKNKGLLPLPDNKPEYFVVILQDVLKDALSIISKMRKKHIIAYDYNGRNVRNQMKYANSIEAKKVIVLGPDEIKSGVVKVRDMKSGKETTQKINLL